jgi:hypothetical protein
MSDERIEDEENAWKKEDQTQKEKGNIRSIRERRREKQRRDEWRW